MTLYAKFIKYLYHHLRKESGHLPPRDPNQLNNSYVHESVNLRKTRLSGNNAISQGVVFYGDVSVGHYSTVGSHTIIHGGTISIGNYCQIGPHCSLYSIEHPVNHLTIYNGKRLFEGRLKSLAKSHEVVVGNGVWIGHGANILKGCKIGNGAIIGANTTVTKNIEPYEIAVGAPAKIVAKRFDNRLIEVIEESQWWNYRPEDLKEFEELFFINFKEEPDKALSMLQEFKAKLWQTEQMP